MALSASAEGQIETLDTQTEVISVKHEQFTVSLHKTYASGALYRVEGSNDEDKYESLIYTSHFDGQECKDYIRSIPTLLEKLFRIGVCDISIKDSAMICEFRTDLMSVRIVLPKVVETQIEMMAKTIRRQEKQISELKEENKQFGDRLDQINEQSKESAKKQAEMVVTARRQETENAEFKEENRQFADMVVRTARQQETKNAELKEENRQFANALGRKTKQLKDLEKLLDSALERVTKLERGSISVPQSEKLNKLENSIEILKMGMAELKCKVNNTDGKKFYRNGEVVHTSKNSEISIPPGIFGNWKIGGLTWPMEIRPYNDSFTIQRQHRGNTIFHPVDTKWENGIFCWFLPKQHDPVTDSHYRFDPKNQNTIIEINGSVQNIFQKLSTEFPPSQLHGTWKWCDGTITIECQNGTFNIRMKHQYGEDDCSVINPRWNQGIFSWISKYQGKSCPAVSNDVMNFCYDPQKPNIIIETCGQYTNKFDKV